MKHFLKSLGIYVITILFIAGCGLFGGDDAATEDEATKATVETTAVEDSAGSSFFASAASILAKAIPSYYMKGKYAFAEDTVGVQILCISVDDILSMFTSGSAT